MKLKTFKAKILSNTPSINQVTLVEMHNVLSLKYRGVWTKNMHPQNAGEQTAKGKKVI